MKRSVDVFLSLLLFTIAGPLMAILAVAIVAFSGWPILYRQHRVGRDCRDFTIFKFRTMRPNSSTGAVASGLSKEELVAARNQFVTASKGDPRITPIGRFLRRTSLDELPQLLNVFRGDMSLIGPRPVTPVQRADYSDEEWLQRHKVRPGISGLAQVRGRSNLTQEESVAFDLQYVACQSLTLDLEILALTAMQVLNIGTSN